MSLLIKNRIFQVKDLSPKDANALTQTHSMCFEKPWEEDFFLSLLENSLTKGWGIFKKQQLIAALLLRCDEDQAEILTLFAHPIYRGNGLGKCLLKTALESLNTCEFFLEVEDTNLSAIGLYESMGFETYFKRENYYGPSRHALLMKAKLAPSLKSQS
ncbi:MAG TPA: GNAT family N-acetyltransferase [Alphaproteobacteria bacterium]|nr:GNAT family N-acetyltransferase [Alphaproteobacteria bacterium]